MQDILGNYSTIFCKADICLYVATYPLECAKTLMQVGYEPIFPKTEWWFGRRYLSLPNTYSYLNHIISEDEQGYLGLYRGILPNLVHHIIKGSIIRNMSITETTCNSKNLSFPLKLTRDIKDPTVSSIATSTLRQMAVVSFATAVSHPFYVVGVKMIAQLVGKEAAYASLGNAVKAILAEDGVLGFLKGLVPRLVSENVKICFPAIAFAILTKTLKSRHTVNLIEVLTQILSATYAYQFETAGATWLIANSSLALGKPPFITRNFTNWIECWRYLLHTRLEGRGRYHILRYYNGPVLIRHGKLFPRDVYFGSLKIHK